MRSRVNPAEPNASPSVVDLFCGAGGLAHGFKLEGFRVAAGVDIEAACRFPFEANNDATFHERDVGALGADELNRMFDTQGPRILVGCAPCQPFSTYNQKNEDPQWNLVDKFADLIVATRPDVISMENVPRLLEYNGGSLFRSFARKLKKAGYRLEKRVVFLPGYGLPQRRTRLVVVGSLHGIVRLERPTYGDGNYRTVLDEIGEIPEIGAGDTCSTDRLHCTSRLSELNLRRLRASKPGGTWRDWDKDLVAECHRNSTGKGYGAVYGRMEGDAPSPTITTQFFGFGSGRFGHPVQDRALSLREGARLQSFPANYQFVDRTEPINMRRIGRLIGNAVPPLLGQVVARAVSRHLRREGLLA